MLSAHSFAGGYYNPSIDAYDPETGLYYKSVESEKKSGFLSSGTRAIVNLYIYNPDTDEGKYLFPKQENFQVVALLFETAVEDGQVKYHSDYSSPVKNNHGVPDRKPKTKMLVLTRNVETERETFYFAEKDGSKLEAVKSITSSDNWHVDVKNSVVRIVSQKGLDISVDSFSW
ncbi:hypothetical protein [Zooshikella ganghwensis]|uniref:hypothetical protein n=1 Tax=Zooshikella ganghwensis TaxID=202772 RepID=UPI000402B943|nr:hypothetical protein [Zooshikella ganghwensis]